MIDTDRKMNRKGRLFVNNYEYESHLGSGGFGDVFAAVRAHDRLPVAIKFIDKETVYAWGKVFHFFLSRWQCLSTIFRKY